MTERQRAIREIDLQLEVLALARAEIKRRRNAGEIEDGYATSKLEEIAARETDLRARLGRLMGTAPVTSAPNPEQLATLEQGVNDLRNGNYASANAHGAVSEFFTIVGIVVG